MNQPNSPVETREQLGQRIAKCNRIINGLKNHAEYIELIEDYRNEMKRLDDSWHLIQDTDKLKTFQITKLAHLAIINSLDNYQHDLNVAQSKLIEMDNQDVIISKDFDNDGSADAKEN